MLLFITKIIAFDKWVYFAKFAVLLQLRNHPKIKNLFIYTFFSIQP